MASVLKSRSPTWKYPSFLWSGLVVRFQVHLQPWVPEEVVPFPFWACGHRLLFGRGHLAHLLLGSQLPSLLIFPQPGPVYFLSFCYANTTALAIFIFFSFSLKFFWNNLFVPALSPNFISPFSTQRTTSDQLCGPRQLLLFLFASVFTCIKWT